MTTGRLLAELRERGIELVAEGDRLRCIAPTGALTPELSARIREEKAALLLLLASAMQGEHQQKAGNAIPRVQPAGRYQLSLTQQRAVVAGRTKGALPTAFLLRGRLNLEALEVTLQRIVSRHSTLRTRFILTDEEAQQEVLEDVRVELPTTVLEGVPEPERADRLRDLLNTLSRVKFDVSETPLFRFHLVRLSEIEHVLHTAFNVLIFDGWSFDVFWQELRAGYAALANGETWPTDSLGVSYEDFVAWQRQRLVDIAHQAEFWRQVLGSELPKLGIHPDRPRGSQSDARGGNIPFHLTAEAAVALRRFAQSQASTPQIVMLAALYTLIARIGETNDIVIATPVDARTNPSIEVLIGPFVNLVLLRAQIDTKQPFTSLVAKIGDLCLAAYDHQEFPIEKLALRSPRAQGSGLHPAFQVEFSYQQVSQRGSHMGDLALSQFELESGAAANDITLWVKDWGERIAGAVEFKPELFDRETVEHWVGCYKHLLRELIRYPDRMLCEADLLGPQRPVVEAQMARLAETMPAWAGQRLNGAGRGGRNQFKLVDAQGELCPFGAAGELVIAGAEGVVRTGIQARMAHTGVLQEVPDAGLPLPSRNDPPATSSAATELEMRLCLLFEQVLNLQEIRVEQDFFDLGGNSLLAARLFALIDENFGVRLPMTTVLEARSPRRLAEVIKLNVHRESCVVRLKSGNGDFGLFLVHDGDGETLLYRNIALRMPDAIPVYGIEPLRAGRIPMVHTTIEELAAHYVREMRRLQPHGPYHLGGLCAGGLISFEMAHQLEQQGEQVPCLVLIEASPPQAQKRATVMQQRWQRVSGLWTGTTSPSIREIGRAGVSKLVGFTRYETGRRIERSLTWAGCMLLRHWYGPDKNWPKHLPAPSVRQVFALAEREYVPPRLRTTQVVIFRATQGEGDDLPLLNILVDPLFEWEQFLDCPPIAVDVPGGHGTLLRDPHAIVMAEHLRSHINKDVQLKQQPDPQQTTRAEADGPNRSAAPLAGAASASS